MPENMRPQVGLNLNVPIRRTRRCAAVQEASAKLQQRRAELQSQLDDVQFEVQSAVERLAEQQTIIRLYAEKTIPAARENVQSAGQLYGGQDRLSAADRRRTPTLSPTGEATASDRRLPAAVGRIGAGGGRTAACHAAGDPLPTTPFPHAESERYLEVMVRSTGILSPSDPVSRPWTRTSRKRRPTRAEVRESGAFYPIHSLEPEESPGGQRGQPHFCGVLPQKSGQSPKTPVIAARAARRGVLREIPALHCREVRPC